MILVAAVDSNKETASFSPCDNQVEISALGVLVRSTTRNDEYDSWSVILIATPYVAGVTEHLWIYFLECANYQIRNVLGATAEDLGDADCNTKYAYGLVQAKDTCNLLSGGNYGENIGDISPVRGCGQLHGEPECSSNNDFNDGDTCTIGTCANEHCEVSFQCSTCG